MDKFTKDSLRLYKHAIMGITNNAEGVSLPEPVKIGDGVSITALDGGSDLAEVTLDYCETAGNIYLNVLSEELLETIIRELKKYYEECLKN